MRVEDLLLRNANNKKIALEMLDTEISYEQWNNLINFGFDSKGLPSNI